MDELYQSALLIIGIPSVIGVFLGAKLRVLTLFIISVLIGMSWYLDSYLWSHGLIPNGPELSGIWGGLGANVHRLFIEAITPVLLISIWGSCICTAMLRRVVRRRIGI